MALAMSQSDLMEARAILQHVEEVVGRAGTSAALEMVARAAVWAFIAFVDRQYR
jgi:hypothetical protein